MKKSFYFRALVLTSAIMQNAVQASLASAQIASATSAESSVVIGDSLSDSGNFYVASGETSPEAEFYFNGRYSNGPVWADRLHPRQTRLVDFLGGADAPNGGTYNFAVGGSDSTAAAFDVATGQTPGAIAQSTAYRNFRASGAVPDGAAARRGYIWTGTNDYIGRLSDRNRTRSDDPAFASQVVMNISAAASSWCTRPADIQSLRL